MSRIRDDTIRISDGLWTQVAPLLPPSPTHPLGRHRRGAPSREVLDAILMVYRHGCRWEDLKESSIPCSCWSAYRRYRQWADAGLFTTLQALQLAELEVLVACNWSGPTRRSSRNARSQSY